MDKVYGNACRVIVWLGDEVQEATRLVKQPVAASSFPQWAHLLHRWGNLWAEVDAQNSQNEEARDPAHCLQTIVKLTASPWWERIWVRIMKLSLSVAPEERATLHLFPWS